MNRHIVDIPTNLTVEQVNGIIAQFMQVEGFKQVTYKGEPILTRGKGFLSAPQFLKIDVRPGMVRLEAFLKMQILPFVYVGEIGLGGRDIARWKLKECVDRLVASINR